LKERADTVSKRKNRFVAMVLNQYGINYCIDRHGIVTRINFTGDWLKVIRYRCGSNGQKEPQGR